MTNVPLIILSAALDLLEQPELLEPAELLSKPFGLGAFLDLADRLTARAGPRPN